MELDRVTEIGVNALKEAYHVQRKLLKENTIANFVDSEGLDRTTVGDWESEEVVIEYLRKNNFPGRIIAEEHGEIRLGNKYLAVLDGIDGSSALVNDIETRCGTILTISDKLELTYDDFVFTGITEYITKRIVYGVKGEGVWLIEDVGDNEIERKLSDFSQKPLSKDRIIKIDCYDVTYAQGVTAGIDTFKDFMMDNVARNLDGKMKLTGSITSSEMCIDLLLGDIDAVAHVVAKGVFEPPNIYLLTKELGGSGTDLGGNDLGPRKWEPVGMNVDGAIFASSPQLGKSITDLLQK